MRSKPAQFRLPTALEECTRRRVQEAGYESLSEYVLGLVRYDLLTRKPHPATAGIANLTRAEQDRVDDEIATMFAKNETLGGSWFEARLQAAVEASGKPAPEQQRIVAELLRRISGRNQP